MEQNGFKVELKAVRNQSADKMWKCKHVESGQLTVKMQKSLVLFFSFELATDLQYSIQTDGQQILQWKRSGCDSRNSNTG